MDLEYGFKQGNNIISKKRIQAWQHSSEDIDMRAFAWYITQYFQVQNYSTDWIDVKIWNEKQREQFYHWAKEYDNEMWYSNYVVDKGEDLYPTHHRGYERNKEVIERLVMENI